MYNTILKLRDQLSLCEHLHVFRTCAPYLDYLLPWMAKKKKKNQKTQTLGLQILLLNQSFLIP